MAVELIESLVIHESCSSFRKLTKDEYAILLAGTDKPNVPILIWRKMDRDTKRLITFVMDGAHRVKAWKEKGQTTIDCQEFKGFESQAIAFAEGLNKGRRQEPLVMRAIAAAEKANAPEGRRETTSSTEPVVSISQAATEENVSPATVKRVKQVLENGVPEVVQAMKDGDIGIAAAASIATEPPAKQKKAMNGNPKKRTTKSNVDKLQDLWNDCTANERTEFREWIDEPEED